MVPSRGTQVGAAKGGRLPDAPSAILSPATALLAVEEKRKAAVTEKTEAQKAKKTAATAPASLAPATLPSTSVPDPSNPSKLKAKTPLVCWTVLGKNLHPSGIAQLLFAIKSTASLPEVDTCHVCFPYLMDANGTGCGYDGTMRALHGTPAQ